MDKGLYFPLALRMPAKDENEEKKLRQRSNNIINEHTGRPCQSYYLRLNVSPRLLFLSLELVWEHLLTKKVGLQEAIINAQKTEEGSQPVNTT